MAIKYYREDLKNLKERRGKISEELQVTYKRNNKLVREVKKVFLESKDPITVPEIAKIVDYPTNEIFFAVMCLKKFNQLELLNKRGEFPSFGFKEEMK